jgi:hypothetical protein
MREFASKIATVFFLAASDPEEIQFETISRVGQKLQRGE